MSTKFKIPHIPEEEIQFIQLPTNGGKISDDFNGDYPSIYPNCDYPQNDPQPYDYPDEEYDEDYSYVDGWEAPDGKSYSTHGCFGYIGDMLILGNRHHQAIMALLIDKGWSWEQLMTAEQIWGWYDVHTGKPPHITLNFVSDAAFLHKPAAKKCKVAFRELFGIKKIKGSFKTNRGDVLERGHGEYGGDYEIHYNTDPPDYDKIMKTLTVSTELPEPPKEED